MNIKGVIKEKGFTIEQVAGKMGITRITLTQCLSGNPTVNTLQRIAEAINCNVSDFFMDEIDTTQNNKSTCPHCGKPIEVSIGKL